MACDEINQELTNLTIHDSQLEAQIHGNRGQNQAAGYIAGVIFLPAVLAADNDKSAKGLLDRNQTHRDHLILAQKVKGCLPKSSVAFPSVEEQLSIAYRIKRLDSLFKKKLISKPEYEQRRKEILNSL
jgi:hypothetical protein